MLSEERLAELAELDRGPCLPAVRELVAEVRRARATSTATEGGNEG